MPTEDVLIRKARKEDYVTLMELYNQFVGEDRYSKHTFDSFFSVLTNSANRIFVAEKAGVLMGFATVSFRRVVRYPKPIAELDELFVSESVRKMGVGRRLLDAVVNEAKKRDCYRIYIESGHKQTLAHALYKVYGFTEYGLHFIKTL